MKIKDQRKRPEVSTFSLREIASRHTWLARDGQHGEWWGCCPFHTEKTPSFSVNEEKGVFSCFGCGKAGDAITLLRELEGKSFREAAAEVGKDLLPHDPQVDRAAWRRREQFFAWRGRQFVRAYQALTEARNRLVGVQFAQRCFQRAPSTFTAEETAYFAGEMIDAEAEFQSRQEAFLLMSPEGDEATAMRIWEETL